ncbi:MAG: 50S ribosomal protein L6 [Candidatus Azambacteria bacterium]|nr:50S ribosomal protein L6 [Candidatus Azambacteria bacterium]
MASLTKNSIKIPETIEVRIEGDKVSAKGPKGELSLHSHPAVVVTQETGLVIVQRAHEKAAKAFVGLTRALIANMVKGVSEGFMKKLELEGVGYRVALTGSKLVMQLGFSHPVEFEAPEGIIFQVEKNAITVSGIDKALVGQTAANIRKIKKPEPYKGKGIRYTGEIIRRKEGKRAGTA